MKQDEHEITTHGADRRDKMLPLLQEAMKEHSRRRRQRRSIACSVLAFCLFIVLYETFSSRDATPPTSFEIVMDRPLETIVADSSAPEPSASETESFNDVRPFYTVIESESAFERCLQRNPDLIIDDAVALAYTAEATGVSAPIREITTDELVASLAEAGISTAISCSEKRCTLYTTSGSEIPLEENHEEKPVQTTMATSTPETDGEHVHPHLNG